ncbi:hypothetical protein F511_07155 [Dorcoceras hygrometricum]|nr:hypothetical protein F511_07155 [Dorcoceras hygrometricum]
MAAVTSVSITAIAQSSDWKFHKLVPLNCDAVRFRSMVSYESCCFRASSSSSTSRMVVRCMSTTTGRASETLSGNSLLSDVPTVSETKLNFLKAYKRPIPSIYNTVLQELIVQQHLMRYKKSYRYDPVFALGFVTVYDQLMDGYPGDEDRDAIFKAYVEALKEDPAQYRHVETFCTSFAITIFVLVGADAVKVEEWARAQSSSTLVDFGSRQGEVEGYLKDIAERARTGSFSYSRFFAVGLFRLLELANATEPTVLEKLCAALNVNKKSVDRDLDVYRNLLSKLVQAKELLKEYIDREKKKIEERSAESQKSSEAVKKFSGDYQSADR